MKMNNSNKKFQDYGGLFKNKKSQHKRAPQLLGEILLSPESIRHLVEATRSGEKPVLNLAAWSNIAQKTGEKYFTLKATPPIRQMPQGMTVDDDPFDL
jgi:hypothetical protein